MHIRGPRFWPQTDQPNNISAADMRGLNLFQAKEVFIKKNLFAISAADIRGLIMFKARLPVR